MARQRATIRLSNGILEPRHLDALDIGAPGRVFLWCLDRQTGADGEVLRGRQVGAAEIAQAVGLHTRTVQIALKNLAPYYLSLRRRDKGYQITVVRNRKFRVSPQTQSRVSPQTQSRSGVSESPMSSDRVAGLTPIYITRSKINTARPGTKRTSPRCSTYRTLTDALTTLWRKTYPGTNGHHAGPHWAKAAYVQISRLAAKQPHEEIIARYRRCLEQDAEFWAGHDLGKFCKYFDSFAKRKKLTAWDLVDAETEES